MSRMPDATRPGDTLSLRALNRATLQRQCLLERVPIATVDVIEHLVGLQAQTPHTAYVGLWDRIEGFRGSDLSDRLVDRSVVRMALMRGTILPDSVGIIAFVAATVLLLLGMIFRRI